MTSCGCCRLEAAALERLGQHRYSCDNRSLVEPFLQRWWCWLVLICPVWLAPNVITLTGLAANVFSTLTLILYSPDATEVVPSWVCLLFAVGLFVYQSLDAIDGKQARRTESSSPLGELFDHGCDSVSVVCVSLAVCLLVGLGEYPSAMFAICFTAFGLFYVAHWQAYITGTLHFGKIDVTEEQWSIIIVFIISSIMGADIWNTDVGSSLKLKLLVLWLGCGLTVVHVVGSLVRCYSGAADGQGVPSTCCGRLLPAVPLLIVLVPAAVLAFLGPLPPFHRHPVLISCLFGLCVSKITCRLVVAHMSKSRMQLVDTTSAVPVLLLLVELLELSEDGYYFYLLWTCMGFVLGDFLLYWYSICNQICRHLGIYCFSLGPRADAEPTDCQKQNGTSAASAEDRVALLSAGPTDSPSAVEVV